MVEKIEAYRCSVCDGIFIGEYDDALKHEQIPLDKQYPKGLVLKREARNPYLLITSSGQIRRGGIINVNDYTHDFITDASLLYFTNNNILDENYSVEISSRKIADEVIKKKLLLLTTKEFERFKKLFEFSFRSFSTLSYLYSFKISELIRATPELEKLVDIHS